MLTTLSVARLLEQGRLALIVPLLADLLIFEFHNLKDSVSSIKRYFWNIAAAFDDALLKVIF